MKIYKIKKNGKEIQVFTRKFIQFNNVSRILASLDYRTLTMQRKREFWHTLRAAGKQLKNGEYLSCFIIERELEFGWAKLEKAKQPYHSKVLSTTPILLEDLKRYFI